MTTPIRATHCADPSASPDLTARLDQDQRHRRRLMIDTEEGEKILIDLAEATALRGGDRLALTDGRTLAIEAAPEPVTDIFAADPLAQARLAWHLGNRHTPTAVLPDRLRIRPDHVLEDMVQRHGARIEHKTAPFDPEQGAYGHAAAHTHPHAEDGHHAHDPSHDHAHDAPHTSVPSVGH